MPYVNSVGERYRVKQLLQQLPPHDNEVMKSLWLAFSLFFAISCDWRRFCENEIYLKNVRRRNEKCFKLQKWKNYFRAHLKFHITFASVAWKILILFSLSLAQLRHFQKRPLVDENELWVDYIKKEKFWRYTWKAFWDVF